jgi:hypothetical protein
MSVELKNQEAHDSLATLIHGLENMTIGTNGAGDVHVEGQHGAAESGLAGGRKAQIVNGFKRAIQYKEEATSSMRNMLVKFTEYVAHHTSTLEEWHDEWEIKVTGEFPELSQDAGTNTFAGSNPTVADLNHTSIS